MSNKLYLARIGRVQEVEILKETPKQFIVGGNIACRKAIIKAEINTFNSDQYVFAYTEEDAIRIYNDGLQSKIDEYVNRAKKLSDAKIRQPITSK